MARRFIADIAAGEMIDDEVFLIRSKDLRTTAQGALYIHAVLADRTGQLVARAWQATEAMFKTLPDGGFVRLKGRAESYKGNLQFIIDAIRPVDQDSVDLTDFLPKTDCDIDEMWARVCEILDKIEQPDLAALMAEFRADAELMAKFRTAPAAVMMHHAFVGGLLEHTLMLLEIALRVIPLYPKLSLDLVLAGLFLHDIGKTAELGFATHFEYTDEGQLLGHIAQAMRWVDQKTEAIAKRAGRPFPSPIRLAIQHILISHHGRLEFGSPKLPATPEAVAIHYLDNLDAKIHTFLSEIERHPDAQSRWTNYHRGLETKIYRVDAMDVRGGVAAK